MAHRAGERLTTYLWPRRYAGDGKIQHGMEPIGRATAVDLEERVVLPFVKLLHQFVVAGHEAPAKIAGAVGARIVRPCGFDDVDRRGCGHGARSKVRDKNVANIVAAVGGDHLAERVGADQRISRTKSHIRPVLHAPVLISIKEVPDKGLGIDAIAIDAVVLPVRATKAVADVVPGPAIAIEP